MPTFTAVLPTTANLPHDLALLLTPMRANEPSSPEAFIGRTEGALLDSAGHVVAFVVRLAPWLVAHQPRTLVSGASISVDDEGTLHTTWTENQLVMQPRLDAEMQPHDRVVNTAPIESQWMPARPNRVPPEAGANAPAALKDAAGGAAAGALAGAVAGLAIGGPFGALALGALQHPLLGGQLGGEL
jgi:hypothetical protein